MSAYPFYCRHTDTRSLTDLGRPMVFFDQLAANASAHGISVVIYSGNDDAAFSHWSSEGLYTLGFRCCQLIERTVVIQNTTFGGIQGFSQKPSAGWTTDDGAFAGIVHTERNWTYALVAGAGAVLPQNRPVAAYVLARDFIFGTNSTGLVANGSPSAAPAGATAMLEGMVGDVLRGTAAIYAGAGTTQTTVMPASASVAAWNSFIATRWESSTSPSVATTGTSSTGGGRGGKTSAAARNLAASGRLCCAVAVLLLAI
jgi:carboxypeptidase D